MCHGVGHCVEIFMLQIRSVPAAPGNFKTGRAAPILMLVIHTQQGTEKGTEAWFADPESHVAAHYCVSKAGEIVQCVADVDTCFHAGNAHVNACSIGIEMEGFEEKADQTPAQVAATAALIRELCDAHHVPLDRKHVIGHCEVPDPTTPGRFGGAHHHTDPGKGFDLDALVRSAAALPAAA